MGLANTTFTVKGMSCGHCKMAVEKALKGLNGVTGAEADLEKANVTITYDPSAVQETLLRETVRLAGYQPD